MSMRDFLDAECGQNPVLKVASHFTRDSLTSGLGHSSSIHPEQFNTGANRQDVSLLPPTTFQMDSLLKEIQSMNGYANAPVQGPAIAELAGHPEWAAEFLKNEQFVGESSFGQEAWTKEYMSKDLDLDSIWDHEQVMKMRQGMHSMDQFAIGGFPTNSQMPNVIPQSYRVMSEQQSARELLDDGKWTSEYSETREHLPLEKTELMATAEQFLKSVSDPKIKATEFMSYVEQLSTGEIGTDGQKADTKAVHWAEEYENSLTAEQTVRSDPNWVDEFITGSEAGAVGGITSDEKKDEFWQKLNDEWEKLAQDDSPTHPWLSDSAASKFNEPYQFAEENPFQELEDPFEEGKRKLQAGEISSAALLFEAAVLKSPANAECWLLLGTTQVLNEQDPLSISALNKCLELEPNNLTALMSLAASLTNESFQLQACNSLKRWLKHNPKYSNLISEDLGDVLPKTASILPSEELSKIQGLFIQAARQNSTTGIDPDIQCGLGILFNLGSEYEKAADCFQAALNVTPDNPLLWNRLGATLANGGKSSEAIGAYRRALELLPGYVRTRYNLGIACVNLGAYREAAEHFLTSLNMQAKGKSSIVKTKPSNMSDSIWSSLRTSLHLLDQSHLTKLVDDRNLGALNREFNLI